MSSSTHAFKHEGKRSCTTWGFVPGHVKRLTACPHGPRGELCPSLARCAAELSLGARGLETEDTGATERTRCSWETGGTYSGTSRKEREHLRLPSSPPRPVRSGFGACSLVPNCRCLLPALPPAPAGHFQLLFPELSSRPEPSVALRVQDGRNPPSGTRGPL